MASCRMSCIGGNEIIMIRKTTVFLAFLLATASISTWVIGITEGAEAQTLTAVINIRRDTRLGLPYGGAHMAGISSIVWGTAEADTPLEIKLFRGGGETVSRTVISDTWGDFAVSMDRLIEGGDTIQVSDGISSKSIEVPTISYEVNPSLRTASGTGPPNITTTNYGDPHSLHLLMAGEIRSVTTTSEGNFAADFSELNYIAGILGAILYKTPGGDNIYQPFWAADPFEHGKLGDWWADIILGQVDFSHITPNEVVSNRLFKPTGLYVDRSSTPNPVYIYDSGNSRVLGFSHLGVCTAGPNVGNNCTTDSDCPNSTCQIQATLPPDLLIGQPSYNTSTCNSDSSHQLYPDVPLADANSLCGLREEQISISEGWSGATMATDPQGNLYVPDVFNNRVLLYENPFMTDATADFLWGQADFSGITCNRGLLTSHADSKSLCLSPPPGYSDLHSGVALDSAGNLWVTDTQNNRALRFPYSADIGRPSVEADLVLGQIDFKLRGAGPALNQMNKPSSVRVDDHGVVYVADSLNNRILVFEPPLSNGMSATGLLGSDLNWPLGIEIDPEGGFWVNDVGNNRYAHFVDGVLVETPPASQGDTLAGIGVDEDNNILAVGWEYMEGRRLSPPDYILNGVFLESDHEATENQTGSKGLQGGKGLEITGSQLIYGDMSRILFWNNPWNLNNNKEPDGVIGEPDFYTRKRWGPWYTRMRADSNGLLWVLRGTHDGTVIVAFRLPLETGEQPVITIEPPLPLLGGGVLTWEWPLFEGGIDVQPGCDCLWISDTNYHRVFRIEDASTNPIVDIVLGQKDISGTECNQGRDNGIDHPTHPTADSLCYPGALAFDLQGNLFVSDHNLETRGNKRLLAFTADVIPDNPVSAVFGIPASKVLGRNGSFTEPYCPGLLTDPICGSWEPAFDSFGLMVVGFNAYLGPRFPMVYQDPLSNPYPIGVLGDFHSMPMSARFDHLGNLYIIGGNRNRILIYQQSEPKYLYIPLIANSE